MINYLKDNLFSIAAVLISLASFGLSYKNYRKSTIKLKLSSNPNENICLGLIWYNEYRLIFIDLTIENCSTSAVDISRIKLIDKEHCYLANSISIKDSRNPNGISLISNDKTEIIRYNISTDNILNNTRISSYGTIRGYAVFNEIDLISSPTSFKLIIDTPSKSFATNIVVNLCPNEFAPLNPLNN